VKSALLLGLAAAALSFSHMAVAQEAASGPIEVVGTLTEEGVECPAMRDDEGNLYTLAGDIGTFQSGDRVIVQGEIAEMSICMQGTTISVTRIDAMAQ
jgi:hypothetical protein